MRASVQEVAVAGRRERKQSELDARMYATARNLFLRQGFEVTAVEQIAEAADIAAATFFTHFQSKHALLGEMTSEVFDRPPSADPPEPRRLLRLAAARAHAHVEAARAFRGAHSQRQRHASGG